MAWRIYLLSAEKKEAVEEVLTDDVLWRQTRLFREAQLLGGKVGEYYLHMNGSDDAMKRADQLLAPLTTRVSDKDGDRIYGIIKEEEEKMASGMGMIFPD